MVFGWGRKKAPEPASIVREIHLEEAQQIAADAHRRRSEQIITESSNTLHRTNDLIRELVAIRRELESDDLRMDDVDKRLRPLVVRGKKMLIEALKNNAVEIKPIRTYADMVRASEELGHHLKKTGNILGKQTRVIHVFADKYAARLKQILEEVDGNRKGLLTAVAKHQNDSGLASSVEEGIGNIRALENSARENAGKGKAAEREKEQAESRIQQVSGEIYEFKESEEYHGFLGLKDTMKAEEAARASLTAEVAAQFTKVSRPLGRYAHISADKDQKALLRRVLDGPYETMNRQDMDDVIMLLERARKAVLSGAISVKDTDKAVDAITQTQEAIGGFVERASGIATRIRDTSDMIRKSSPVGLHALEKELESLLEAKADAGKKIEDMSNATRLAASAIPAELVRVQESLRRLTGTRYQVLYQPPRE